jgi:hypothetical protein
MAIVSAVKVQMYWRNYNYWDVFKIVVSIILSKTILKWSYLHRFLWTSKQLLLFLLEWSFSNFKKYKLCTNWHQEFIYTVNQRKQRGPQRNLVDLFPIYSYVNPPICFHLNRVGNINADISSEKHFEDSKTMRGKYSFTTRTIPFCQNILILSRDSVL